jgi:hypothetical protein
MTTAAPTAYDRLLASMPPGLDRAILRVLTARPGRASAVGRAELVRLVNALGFDAQERQVREEIKLLRRAGHLIGSAPGEDGGYYWISSLQEYEEFDQREFSAKISDMAVTRAAMNAAARSKFGDAIQQTLF